LASLDVAAGKVVIAQGDGVFGMRARQARRAAVLIGSFGDWVRGAGRSGSASLRRGQMAPGRAVRQSVTGLASDRRIPLEWSRAPGGRAHPPDPRSKGPGSTRIGERPMEFQRPPENADRRPPGPGQGKMPGAHGRRRAEERAVDRRAGRTARHREVRTSHVRAGLGKRGSRRRSPVEDGSGAKRWPAATIRRSRRRARRSTAASAACAG